MNQNIYLKMKKIFLAIALISGFMVAQAQTKAPNEKQAVNGPKMEFETSVMDYGLIEHNADGKREFVLTNTGNAPLIISNAKGSCGCTWIIIIILNLTIHAINNARNHKKKNTT